VRGLIDAYDAKTGKKDLGGFGQYRVLVSPVMRPGPAKAGRLVRRTTWVTGVYDEDANLIYWGNGQSWARL